MPKKSTWTIRVDWRGTAPLHEPTAIAIMEALKGRHPVISPSQPAERETFATHHVMLHIPDATIRQATTTALAAVEDAVTEAQGHPAEITGLEVITRREAKDRLNTPQIPDLVGTAETAEILGISRPRVKQLAERDDFPPVVMEVAATPLRIRSQVEHFATKARSGGRPRSASPAVDA